MNADLTSILDNDIDTATDKFIDTLHDAAAASIPRRQIQIRSDQKTWVTAELRKHIQARTQDF